MKLVIGGYAQGKLDYVLKGHEGNGFVVWDGALGQQVPGKTVIFNHFHKWVRAQMLAGSVPEEEVEMLLSWCPECVIISDEVGNGIVPVDVFEREYRERTGRILVKLAARAETVERVFCGIGQKIK